MPNIVKNGAIILRRIPIKERELWMKKQIVCLMAAALMIFTAGCAKQGAAVNADVNTIADQIIKDVKFKDQMSPIEQKTAIKNYGLNASDVTKAKVYESTGATAEEVAAFEAKDNAAADRVKKAAEARVEDQKEAFQGYQPKEMVKLKTPFIVESGKYVVLVIADDTSPAKSVTDQYLK